MRRGKKSAVREPHPDPAVEARLLQLITLQSYQGTITRLAEDYRVEISTLNDEARHLLFARSSSWQSEMAMNRSDEIHQRLLNLTDVIEETQAKIARAIEGLSESDLAWLTPRKELR